MARLFPRLPFVHDETPLSWATRMAAFHTGGRLVPFLNDLGIALMDVVAGAAEAVMRLCDIADQDPAPVLHNTIHALGDLCRKHGVSEGTFYKWKAKFGGLLVSEAKRLKALKERTRS